MFVTTDIIFISIFQPQMNYQGGGGGGSGGGYGGGQNSHQYDGGMGPMGGSGGGTNSHYDPSEVLSDAIATVVFMPSKVH